MITQTILFSILICGAVIADTGVDGADMKNDTGEGHYWPPGGGWGPNFFPPGPPPPSPGMFPPVQPPMFPPTYPPFFFDRFYCSVHASFSLVSFRDHHHHHHHHHQRHHNHHPPTGDSFYGPPVGEHGGGFPRFDVSRQFCRYTAATGNENCNQCCRIAARHVTTSLDDVKGILIAFDPYSPPFVPDHESGSSLRKKRVPQFFDYRGAPLEGFPTPQTPQTPPSTTSPPPTTKQPSTDNRVVQCVCCAPRKRWGLY